MRCAVKECEEKHLALSKFCWDHLQDKEEYRDKLREALRTGDLPAGANLKKVVLKNAHIEKCDLGEANLSQASLRGSRLFDVKLEGAELVGADLTGCDLSHCDLKDADLTRAVMVNARMWNAVLINANLTECDLSCADLWNARLFNVKLWHACLAGAKSLTKANFSGDRKLFDDARIGETGELSAEESYRDLKQYFMSCGRYNDASWASFKEKTMERLVYRKRGDLNYFPSLFMSLVCGYGEKPYRIVLSSLSTIGIFAFLYWHFNSVEFAITKNYLLRWSDYLYYSAITFTTVGYGDFIPNSHSFSRLLSALEAFMGVFLTGLFIFTLARKYSAR